MALRPDTDHMTSIIPIPVETTMRRAMAGVLATDPTFDERRRRVRRPAGARRTPARPPRPPAGPPPGPARPPPPPARRSSGPPPRRADRPGPRQRARAAHRLAA